MKNILSERNTYHLSKHCCTCFYVSRANSSHYVGTFAYVTARVCWRGRASCAVAYWPRSSAGSHMTVKVDKQKITLHNSPSQRRNSHKGEWQHLSVTAPGQILVNGVVRWSIVSWQKTMASCFEKIPLWKIQRINIKWISGHSCQLCRSVLAFYIKRFAQSLLKSSL